MQSDSKDVCEAFVGREDGDGLSLVGGIRCGLSCLKAFL